MKYAIMGAGGVGGYFGARLAAAGDEVVFIARGAHKAAMKANGLTLHSPLGDVRLEAVEVEDDPEAVGLCDIILFCVKLWDVEDAAETIRPLLSNDTCVVPIQNGVGVTDTLARLLGRKHVMGGVAQISASIEAPGVIRHHGDFARLIFGELDGSATWRQECLLAACTSAGIEARVSPAIAVEIWKKFVFLAPMAGATAFYRAPIGEILADPARRARLEAMIGETAAVGRAKGVALGGDQEALTLAFLEGLPPAMKASMLLDLELGRRLELDWLNGEVVRLGRELGVETPENAAVYEALKPFAMGQDR
jgi:2-dehydropantoate 2-reductase